MKAETENGTENRDVTNYAILAGLSENYYKRLVVDMRRFGEMYLL
jgi:hypothetical protein